MAEEILPILPHDILRVIGAHWAGHRIHYTCEALYASWNPDDHIVVNQIINCISVCMHYRRIVTRRMPNGVYHGDSVNTRTPSLTSDWVRAETINYYRGNPMSTVFRPCGRYHTKMIVNGWIASWDSRDDPNEIHDAIGVVVVRNEHCTNRFSRYGVPFRDFPAVAREMANLQGTPGGIRKLELMMCWEDEMPGTVF